MCGNHLEQGWLNVPRESLYLSFKGGADSQYSLGIAKCVAYNYIFNIVVYSGNTMFQTEPEGFMEPANFASAQAREAEMAHSMTNAVWARWPLRVGLVIRPVTTHSAYEVAHSTAVLAMLLSLAQHPSSIEYDRRNKDTEPAMDDLDRSLRRVVEAVSAEQLLGYLLAPEHENLFNHEERSRIFQMLFRNAVFHNHRDSDRANAAGVLRRVQHLLNMALLFADAVVDKARCLEEMQLPLRRALRWEDATMHLVYAKSLLEMVPRSARTEAVERRLRSVQHNLFRSYGDRCTEKNAVQLEAWYPRAIAFAREADDMTEYVRVQVTRARFYHNSNNYTHAYNAYVRALKNLNDRRGDVEDAATFASRILSDLVKVVAALPKLALTQLQPFYEKLCSELKLAGLNTQDRKRRLARAQGEAQVVHRKQAAGYVRPATLCSEEGCDMPHHEGQTCADAAAGAAPVMIGAAAPVAPAAAPALGVAGNVHRRDDEEGENQGRNAPGEHDNGAGARNKRARPSLLEEGVLVDASARGMEGSQVAAAPDPEFVRSFLKEDSQCYAAEAVKK